MQNDTSSSGVWIFEIVDLYSVQYESFLDFFSEKHISSPSIRVLWVIRRGSLVAMDRRRRHYTGLNGFAFRVFSLFSSGSNEPVLAGKRAGSAAGDDAAIAHKAGGHLQEDSQPAAHPRAGRHVLQQLVGRLNARRDGGRNNEQRKSWFSTNSFKDTHTLD